MVENKEQVELKDEELDKVTGGNLYLHCDTKCNLKWTFRNKTAYTMNKCWNCKNFVKDESNKDYGWCTKQSPAETN